MKKYILGNGVVATVNKNMEVISEGAVVINGNKIQDVGKDSKIKKRYSDYKYYDTKKSLIMPGLVNTHTHLGMTLFRGLAEDLDLKKWLEKTYNFRKKFVTKDMLKIGIQLSLLELLKSGTTTVCDMSFHQRFISNIVNKFKIRTVLCDTMMTGYYNKEILDDIRCFLERNYKSGLINKALALHAPYTCEHKHFKWLKNMVEKYKDIPYSIHLLETKNERNIVKEKLGMSPVDLLKKYNLLSDRLLAVHCVWLTEQEMDILKKYNVKISYNPESNMKLASGIAPVHDMILKGLTVGIGTDGAASNNDLDLFSEMDTGAKLQKVSKLDPKYINAEEIVRMATIEGAKCLGLDSITGSLEKGKKADMIIVDLQQIRLKPIYNIHSHIVYSVNGRDVTNVIINGSFVVKNKKVKVIDEKSFISNINKINKKINSKLKKT